jgi:hypothetical protein
MVLKILVMIAAVTASPVVLMAATLNLNTGTADWQVRQVSGISNNGLQLNTVTSAVVLTGGLPFAANLPGYEQYAWAGARDGAQWIGQVATDGNFDPGSGCNSASPTDACGAMAGTYVYTLTVRGGFGGSFTLSSFTGDNGITSLTVTQGSSTLYACDQIANSTPNCAPTQATTVSSGLIFYTGGTDVVITATAANDVFQNRNSSGFFLAGSGIANDIPEPASLSMLALAGAVAAVANHRNRKAA